MSYIGSTPTTQSFTPAIDYFSGNGSTTAFTLSRPVASVAQVQVVIDNVPQNPSTAFTVSSSTITFTSAPLSGTNNIYVQYTSPITQIVAPSDGTVTTSVLATNAVTTAKILDANVTPAKLSQPLTSGTAVASTSGTSIDFTSIPSWVKRITVMFNGVSTNGTGILQVQLGSGSPTASGYLGGYIQASSAGAATLAGLTTGFIVGTPTAANATFQGALIINLLSASSNTWTDIGNIADSTNQRFWTSSGTVSLSGTLDRVRITTVGGTDTFDAGSINILYEG